MQLKHLALGLGLNISVKGGLQVLSLAPLLCGVSLMGQTYRCPVCGASCSTQAECEKHIKSEHPGGGEVVVHGGGSNNVPNIEIGSPEWKMTHWEQQEPIPNDREENGGPEPEDKSDKPKDESYIIYGKWELVGAYGGWVPQHDKEVMVGQFKKHNPTPASWTETFKATLTSKLEATGSFGVDVGAISLKIGLNGSTSFSWEHQMNLPITPYMPMIQWTFCANVHGISLKYERVKWYALKGVKLSSAGKDESAGWAEKANPNSPVSTYTKQI